MKTDLRSIYLNDREELIAQAILSENLTTRDAIEAAKLEGEITNESISTVLVANGFVSKADITGILVKIDKMLILDDEYIMESIPADLLIKHKIMICGLTDESVYLACLHDQAQVAYLLGPYCGGRALVFIPSAIQRINGYVDKLKLLNNGNSGTLEGILRKAINEHASDIHIIPRRNSYSLFMRLLGVRYLIHEQNLDEYLTLASKIKDKSNMDLSERRLPQDGSFSLQHNGRLVDFRVATVPAVDGEAIIIRVLDTARANFDMDTIGVTAIDEWRKGISRSEGLCLICGPTGSGKTTTLNASIRELDRFGKAIYTIEDPVEYKIPFVTQVTINDAVGLSFPGALKSFLRADPDVIIVGEVRDTETARIAIKAAETGHLVLATLHTGSIHGAIQRLRDLDLNTFELKYVLRAILAQRLIRTLCDKCHNQVEHVGSCKACHGRGYSDRTIVSECKYFAGISDVDKLLNSTEIEWQTMIEDAFAKYKKGMTDETELKRVFGAEIDSLIEQGVKEFR
jgi:Tfp pilus assembly pilus retraction ATPase PilT